jgi:hypothetical protein
MRTALTTPVKVTIAIVVAFITIAIASSRIDDYSCDGQTVTVKAGQTLWNVASQHCAGNIEQAVADLVTKHGVYTQVGDIIHLKGK